MKVFFLLNETIKGERSSTKFVHLSLCEDAVKRRVYDAVDKSQHCEDTSDNGADLNEEVRE